jgi:hypothetical protein
MSENPRPNDSPAIQFPQHTVEPSQSQLQAMMQAALTSDVPRFYMNACGVGITPADMVLTLICNGIPVCIVNLAYPTAKAIAEDIAQAISDYEKTSEQKVTAIGPIAGTMQRVRAERGGDTVTT